MYMLLPIFRNVVAIFSRIFHSGAYPPQLESKINNWEKLILYRQLLDNLGILRWFCLKITLIHAFESSVCCVFSSLANASSYSSLSFSTCAQELVASRRRTVISACRFSSFTSLRFCGGCYVKWYVMIGLLSLI